MHIDLGAQGFLGADVILTHEGPAKGVTA